ncbi:SDR family oxidoreductase [Sphingomonas prati]|uniref:Nucleoside-diphosphate-sugar epimerase n=1 Tax=Sphingomonas prati TaxID=1843237 RepID=A0A7W9BSY4_9SPHN|nr:SDR family oxidoreductase [Sphingomonas prati]MBB5729038.1 nucleoside-diphosphate-sugar epimerase [Sphingomonas prati]GGE85562.1 3-beta hydroxysteroid dehydrogenase [Sphingomonas prati]
MRVFVTGATGFVGSAVVAELLGAGHQVLGLARSEASAEALMQAGADVQRGSLEDLQSLKAGAADADAVIHTAFDHDFTRFAENSQADRQAIEALGEALIGTERPLLVTAGVALLAPGRVAVEADRPPADPDYPRQSEAAAAALVERGVRASVVRLPPSVHGVGDHGFVPMLAAIAREKGVSAYIDDGENRWTAVHRLDAAQVYRLALEHGATDRAYHAVAEESIPFRAIAEAVGRQLGLPVRSVSHESAAEHFGWFTMFASMDTPASSERTRTLLGWSPTEVGLLAELERPGYFEPAAA